MNRRHAFSLLTASTLIAAAPAFGASASPQVEVFKSPYCGCCGAWVEHMKAAGFDVKVTQVTDTTATRKRLGLSDNYGSCHTAAAGGYVLEGHVPAGEVKRLLASQPTALGLAVPGMPPSSPGMEVPGRNDPYEVLLIDEQGKSSVFAKHPKA